MGGGPHRKHSVLPGSTRARSSSSEIRPPGRAKGGGRRKHGKFSNISSSSSRSSAGVRACVRVLTVEERSEVRLHLGALLRDVEVAGEVVGETATRIYDGALRDKEGGGVRAARTQTTDAADAQPHTP